MNEKEQSAGRENDEIVQPGYLGPTAPRGQLPSKGERRWIDRPEALLQAVQVLKQAKIVAVDAEFTQVRLTTPLSSNRLALLQLAIDGYCFVVDAWRLADLSPLTNVIGNPNIIVLLYGAGADMQVMAGRELSVAHYYDLEAASRSIFGQHESSLAAMLQRAFNVRLDKSLQRTDWTRRALPTAMISYAARDAEMTLALYYWLESHYSWALRLHEYPGPQEMVAAWIEPFLHGTATAPPGGGGSDRETGWESLWNPVRGTDMPAVLLQGAQEPLTEEQLYADCRAALATLVHPKPRNRLLRLIADLSLTGLAPEIVPLLHAPASEERAGAARTLSRLHAIGARVEERRMGGHLLDQARETVWPSAEALIHPLLQDPVYEVRKAAQTALGNLRGSTARKSRLAPTRLSDGARTWTIGDSDETNATCETSSSHDDSDWKARLRALMDD